MNLRIERVGCRWLLKDEGRISTLKSRVWEYLLKGYNVSQDNLGKVVELLYVDALYAVRLHDETGYCMLQPSDKLQIREAVKVLLGDALKLQCLKENEKRVKSYTFQFYTKLSSFLDEENCMTKLSRDDGTLSISILPTEDGNAVIQIACREDKGAIEEIYKYYKVEGLDMGDNLDRLFLNRLIFTSTLLHELKSYRIKEEFTYEKRRITIKSLLKES